MRAGSMAPMRSFLANVPVGLVKTPSPLRVELHAGPVGQSHLRRVVVGSGCLVGGPFDCPLPQPGDPALRDIGELAFCVSGGGKGPISVRA